MTPSMPLDADGRGVLEADERWLRAFDREDVEALAELYHPEVVVMPPDRADLHGRDAVAAWLRSSFRDARTRQVLVHDEVRTFDDRAILRGRFRLRIAPRDGSPTKHVVGKHLVLWERDAAGRWLVTHDIWSERPESDVDPDHLDLPTVPPSP